MINLPARKRATLFDKEGEISPLCKRGLGGFLDSEFVRGELK